MKQGGSVRCTGREKKKKKTHRREAKHTENQVEQAVPIGLPELIAQLAPHQAAQREPQPDVGAWEEEGNGGEA